MTDTTNNKAIRHSITCFTMISAKVMAQTVHFGKMAIAQPQVVCFINTNTPVLNKQLFI